MRYRTLDKLANGALEVTAYGMPLFMFNEALMDAMGDNIFAGFGHGHVLLRVSILFFIYLADWLSDYSPPSVWLRNT